MAEAPQAEGVFRSVELTRPAGTGPNAFQGCNFDEPRLLHGFRRRRQSRSVWLAGTSMPRHTSATRASSYSDGYAVDRLHHVWVGAVLIGGLSSADLFAHRKLNAAVLRAALEAAGLAPGTGAWHNTRAASWWPSTSGVYQLLHDLADTCQHHPKRVAARRACNVADGGARLVQHQLHPRTRWSGAAMNSISSMRGRQWLCAVRMASELRGSRRSSWTAGQAGRALRARWIQAVRPCRAVLARGFEKGT